MFGPGAVYYWSGRPPLPPSNEYGAGLESRIPPLWLADQFLNGLGESQAPPSDCTVPCRRAPGNKSTHAPRADSQTANLRQPHAGEAFSNALFRHPRLVRRWVSGNLPKDKGSKSTDSAPLFISPPGPAVPGPACVQAAKRSPTDHPTIQRVSERAS
jgi:hypothetical protein